MRLTVLRERSPSLRSAPAFWPWQPLLSQPPPAHLGAAGFAGDLFPACFSGLGWSRMSDPGDTCALSAPSSRPAGDTQTPHVPWNLLSAASPSTGDGDRESSCSGHLWPRSHLPGHFSLFPLRPPGWAPSTLPASVPVPRGQARPCLLLGRLPRCPEGEPSLLARSAAVSLASLLLL